MDRNHLITSWYTNSRTEKQIKDDRVGNKKSLVARSDERCGKVCR